MHNDVTIPHPTRRFSRLAVAVSLLTVPATPAHALSLGEVAHTVASSPWACFGLGCAAGAVVGGLVVGLVGLRSRRRLEERVEDAVYAAEMAQQSAEAAEGLLREAQRIIAAQAQAQAAATMQSAQARAASEETVAVEAPRKRAAHVPAHVASVPKVAEPEHVEPKNAKHAPKPKPVASAPQTSTMSAAERAASIDARVPGFDQSLFPDLVHESTPKEDDFMLAMKAMDETLSATLMLSPREEEKEEEQLFGVEPEFADAASYVDYLVQDEIERNRAGQARRFSRSQLTVFEGTGDINSMRKSKPRKRPRHLARAAQEA